jgi:hypothetical protein
LIRSPEKVINSFGKKIDQFSLEDLGFVQQVELFNTISNKLGKVPPVIDADDLCSNPREILIRLCSELELDYSEEMLTWKTGPHSYDGIWGDYWYRSVNKSSGFSIPIDINQLNSSYTTQLIEKAEPYFQTLNKHKITL